MVSDPVRQRKAEERRAEMQKSREGQRVEEETLATYTAAKGFLISANIGGLLMLYSFTHLYVFGLRPGASIPAALIVALITLALGTAVYWRSRKVYLDLDFPWQRKWEIIATLQAGTAAVFWMLFLLATFLVRQGVELL